jgi:hypothetical protein
MLEVSKFGVVGCILSVYYVLRYVICNEGLKDREERMIREMKRIEVPIYTLTSCGRVDLGDAAP